MLFSNLTLDNFGVFSGKHSFELAPRLEHGDRRHVTLINGHNGAGKTTIFQAMMLALHGPACFGDTPNLQKYHSFLDSRAHHYFGKENVTSPRESGVALSFQYVRSGQLSEICVERRWKKHMKAVRETLHISQDGRPLDLSPDDYQTWIDDLVPPGIGSLCFFDAERLDDLVSSDRQANALRDTLARLLGLDWTERLEVDLDQLMSKQGGTKKIDHLYVKILELRADWDRIEEQLSVLDKERGEIVSSIANSEEAVNQQERRLAAEGGTYAARRPLLQERLQTVQREVEVLSTQLRDLCAELLPFVLAPELSIKLYKRLQAESQARRQVALNALLQEKSSELESTFLKDEVWMQLEVPLHIQKRLFQKLLDQLCSIGTSLSHNDIPPIHSLSEIEEQRIVGWIRQILRDLPQQVQLLGGKLKALKEEQRRIDADLQRAPEEEILAPIHSEIERLRRHLTDKKKRLTALDGQIGILQFQSSEKQKLLRDAIEQHDKVRKFEKQLTYAERSRNVLRTYKDALTRQKLQAVEVALTNCFNQVCRKEHLLSKIQIDPETFAVRLEGAEGTTLQVSDFSAGERQLYGMSVLWALRLVSQSPLPLAIDTPLARLDEVHRLRLIHNYIPQVSDQVLLFATDAEMDGHLLADLKPYLARSYHLNYNAELGETTVVCEVAPASKDVSPGGPKEEANVYGL